MATTVNIQMIGLFVSDFDSCVHFYRALGIPLEVDAHGSYHHAEYSFQDPYFHFALFPAEADGLPSRSHVSLHVDDCEEATRQALANGGNLLMPSKLVTYSGGGITSMVYDPAGNIVELFERQ